MPPSNTVCFVALVVLGVLCQLSAAFQAPLVLTKAGPATTALGRPLMPSSLLGTPRALKPSCRPSMGKLALSMSAVDRRKFLAAAGTLFVGALAQPAPAAAKKLDAKQMDSLAQGLVKINEGYPFEEQTVAVVSDGSPMCASAMQVVEKLGAKQCEIKAATNRLEARATYKEADCAAVIFSSADKVKEFMSGAGLECKRCGFFGGPLPPKWIVVLDASGKSGAAIQEEAELSGRVCEEGGLCYQAGLQIPVYTVEELLKMA